MNRFCYILISAFCLALGAHADPLDTPIPPAIRGLFTYSTPYTLVNDSFNASGAAWASESSTFSGWGTPVGVRTNFQRVVFYVRQWSDTYPVQNLRVRALQGSSSGAVLGDTNLAVSLSTGVGKLVTATFATNILNAAGSNIWFEVYSDGFMGVYGLASQNAESAYPSATYGIAKYSTTRSLTSLTLTSSVSHRAQWVQFWSPDTSSALETRLSSTFSRYLNSDTVISSLLSVNYGVTESLLLGPVANPTFGSETSTFSGWGQAVGVVPAFNSVQLWIRFWSTAGSSMRVIVRATNNAGGILVDKTISVSAAVGDQQWITCTFPSMVNTNAPLWVEYHCDAKCGRTVLSPTFDSQARLAYSTASSVTTITMTPSVGAGSFIIRFGTLNDAVASIALTDAGRALFGSPASVPQSNPSFELLIPPNVYSVEGLQFNLYKRNAISQPSSILLEQIDDDAYFGTMPTTTAKQYKDFVRFTPTNSDIGSYACTYTLKWNEAQVASKTFTNNVSALTNGNTLNRKLLVIGDSTTANGICMAELKRLFLADTRMTNTLVGSVTNTTTDSLGTNQTVQHTGISGWTVSQFATATNSPFYLSGAFSFNYFLTNRSITMSSGDWVMINLGINDVFGITSDVNLNAAIDTISTQIETMITSMKAGVSGVRVGVCLTIPAQDQNTTSSSYGTGQTAARYRRNNQLLVKRLISDFGGRQSSSIYLVPIHLGIDMINNVPLVSENINSRQSAVTFSYGSNGVHPGNEGYWQIADQYYAFLKFWK